MALKLLHNQLLLNLEAAGDGLAHIRVELKSGDGYTLVVPNELVRQALISTIERVYGDYFLQGRVPAKGQQA